MASLLKKYECLFNATAFVAYKLERSHPLHISLDFIRSLHKELYAYYRPAAGNFRTPVYGVKVISKTLKPVPASEIRTRLLDLTEFINKRREKAAMYRRRFSSKIRGYRNLKEKDRKFWYAIFSASYVHHQTTFIHPFTGGNGRLARLLMSMELANHGMYKATYPPLLNEAIKMNRDGYLDALEKADRGDIVPFCIFLAKMLRFAVRNEDKIMKKIKSYRKILTNG